MNIAFFSSFISFLCMYVYVCAHAQLNSVLLPDLAVPYNLIYFMLVIIQMLFMNFDILADK